MKQRGKRLLSLLLVMALLFGSFVSVGPGVIKADAASDPSLEGIHYTENSKGEVTITGCDKNTSGTIDLCEIFKGKKVIGIKALKNSNITRLVIPTTCQRIGDMAFYSTNTSMLSVTFKHVEGFTDATDMTVGEMAFRACDSLSTVTLPDWTSSIGAEAFSGDKMLSNFKIPSKCKEIGNQAFYGCRSLKELTIPAGCTSIGTSAFGCSTLGMSSDWMLLEKVTFASENEITSLPDNVFNGCHKLKEINLPDNIETIGSQAFGNCSSLASIVIPKACAEIQEQAFNGCSNLAKVVFQDQAKVKTIGKKAFQNCSIESLNLPATLEKIGSNAFEKNNFTSVSIPAACTSIDDRAFQNCSKLTEVTFSGTKDSEDLALGQYSFNDCGITKVKIPANCIQINEGAFCGNPLTRVDFGENNAPIGQDAFKLEDKGTVDFYGADKCTNAATYAKDYTNSNNSYKFQVYSSKLEVEQKPDKVNYDLGEDLDTTGMVIRATYDKTAGKASTADSGTPDISDCVITGFDNKTVGTQKITVAYGDAKTTFDVNVRLNLAKLGTYGKVETPDATKTYNGKEITPSVKVSVKTADGTWRTLTSEKEYNKPVYKNNVNAYTGNTTGSGVSASAPSITVSGDGVYTTGKVTKYFNIDKRTMDDVTVSVADGSVYSGTEKKPEVTVTYNGKTVPSDQYNAVVYKNNINAAKSNDAEAPYVKVTASSNSNFKDSKIAYFGIDPLDLEKAEITVDTGKDQTYTGKTVKPEKVTVTRPDPKTSGETITLQSGKDYEVSAYNNNTNVGAATATLTGKGNYTGTYNTIYNIVPRKLDDASMEVSKLDEVTYDGKNHAPVVKVNYNRGTDDVVTLKEGTDYKVTLVASADAVLKEEKEAESDVITAVGKVGSYKVVVEGMGNYDGTVERTFTIKKIDLSDAKITVPEKNIYDGEAVCPEVTVVKDGETLVKDQDYTVSYEDNEAVGTGKVIITGAGNYEGSCEAAFEIIGVPLFEEDGADNAEIAEIADQTYDPKGNTPAITVTKKGETLVQDKDYTVEYENNKAVGTAKVTITGIGKYSGKMEKEFKIVAADVKNAEISAISDQVYTGAEIKPEVTVTYGKKTVSGVTSREDWGTNATNNGTQLVAGKDYTVDYKDNVTAGTATVTVTGKGNYAGTLTKTFTIAAADIETAKISDIADQTYTGSAFEPEVTVTYGEQDDAYELKADEDYTVAYDDNVAAGTATVTVTGKGNYAGTLTKTFTIAAADIKAAKISAVADQAYTGAAITPEVTVIYGNQNAVKLIAGTDYTVSYGNNVFVGTATITVTGKGNYAGTLTQTFTIVAPAPAPTPDVTTQETDAGIDDADLDGDDDAVVIPTVKKIKQVKVTAKKKALVLKWKKMSGVAKYQIQFSTNKNFKKAKTYNVKKSQTSVNIKRLKKATKYYVRIRACKTYTDEDDNDKTVYGAWVTVNKKTK